MPARQSKPSGIRGVLATILSPLATLVGLGTPGGYHATDPRRKIIDRGTLIQARSTANQLLNGSLAALRGYCRNLERNNPTARAGIEALRGIVVGSGIALEPDTGDQQTDDLIRAELTAWLDHCGVDGSSIWQLQHLGMGEVVSAGEALWRLVPSDDPNDTVPLRVLSLDAEWLRDDASGNDDGLTVVAGIKLDRYGRPVSYLVRNPERGGDDAEEVPASRIIHAFERRRPVQHRGEPWFAPLIETLIQERDLVDAELKAAVNTASLGIAIESDYQQALDTTEYGDSDDPVQQLKIGSVVRLFPGEKVAPFSHTRPSQQIAPFRQMLRGDIAAALRIPQRFLDRDVSRANYSSMRADMIDTERLIGPVREWYGRQTIGRLYELVLPLICARLGIAVPRGTYRLVPDGQPYVDPLKDAQAAITAIGAGLSTMENEIGKRGGDWKQVQLQKRVESIAIAENEVERLVAIQSMVNDANAKTPGLNLNWAQIATIGGAASAPGAYLQAASVAQQSQATTTTTDVGGGGATMDATKNDAEDNADSGDQQQGNVSLVD